jgi:hypothetical protein
MGSCLFLRLWIWCISVFFNDKKKNLLKYTVEGRIKRNIKIKRERKQSQEREERKESKTKTQNFFCHWWCLRHARLVCWSWLLGVSLHVCSMNSGIPADESRFKEIELRGKSESFSYFFFFFCISVDVWKWKWWQSYSGSRGVLGSYSPLCCFWVYLILWFWLY